MALARHARRPRIDDGFTMVEVVVAMAVFAVTVTSALALILGTGDVLRANTQRVTAANLAAKQLEAARSQRALDIPDGATSRTEAVGPTAYTVTQNANYVVAGSGTSTCRGTGDRLAYKLVTVTVTWPGMGAVAPVRSDTLIALGVGSSGLDPSRGSLAVGVVGASGDPVPDVAVTLSPGGQTRRTGLDGCAVFTGLAAPASYTATASRPGHVGPAMTATASLTQGVRSGRVDRAELLYDAARTARVELAVPAGHSAPSGLPLVVRTSHGAASGARLPACASTGGGGCVTAVPGTARNLFPAVHELWAGACSDARGTPASVDLTGSSALVPTATVPLGPVRVRVVTTGDVERTGRAVQANHAAQVGGCTAGERWDLPTTGAAGSLGALPFGTWTLSTPSGTAPKTVTLSPGQPVLDVVLSVTS